MILINNFIKRNKTKQNSKKTYAKNIHQSVTVVLGGPKKLSMGYSISNWNQQYVKMLTYKKRLSKIFLYRYLCKKNRQATMWPRPTHKHHDLN